MPDPTGLQYMPGGKLYGLNSPFITSNNPPTPSTDNKLGYLGMSGKNSATYTPPPSWVATVDNPGTFVPSQPLVENTNGVRSAPSPGGGSFGFNPVAQAPGNGGLSNTTGSSSFGSFNPMTGAPGNTSGLAPTGSGGKQPYQQSSGLPQPDIGGITQPPGSTFSYTGPRDQVVDAMTAQQQPSFGMYNPLKGLFSIGNR